MKDERRTPKGTPSLVADRGEGAGVKILDAARRSASDEARKRAISDGLSRIWSDDAFARGELTLFEVRSKRARRASGVIEAAAALASGNFTCSSCALFRAGSDGRTAPNVVAIPGVWLDLDTKDGAHRKQNLPTHEEALAFVAGLPLLPTFILSSGGGLYCWWSFAELWVFDSVEERPRAARLVAGWHAFVRDVAAGHGWHVDNTSSLVQVLRAEGSFNDKYSPPREVKCISDAGKRWNPSDFEQWIDLSGAPQGPKSKAPQCASGALPADELRAALTHIDCAGTSYEQWRNVGFGLHHYSGGDDAGFALWDEWSSRDVARYEGTAALRKLWDGFGRSDAHRRPVTIRTVVALARLGGWRGALPDPTLVAPLPIAAPTRPESRDIHDASQRVGAIAREFKPGERSIHLQSWPGCGKTTVSGQVALERIAAGDHDWTAGAVLALPERSLVHEKVEALRSHASRLDVAVPVRVLLGRSGERDSGWWCERFRDASRNGELGRQACSRCPLKGSYELEPDGRRRTWVDGPCATEPGRYLHSRKDALQSGGLVVTTHAALAHSHSELDERRVLIIDDPGSTLCLTHPVELRSSDIDAALVRVLGWREQTQSPPLVDGGPLPEIYVADVAIATLRALHKRGRDRTLWIESAVCALPEGVKAAIREGSIHPPRDALGRFLLWPWELELRDDGPDGSPAFTDLALDIAREVLAHGHAPIVERVDRRSVARGSADLRIHLPDRHLIARAKGGRVMWLSVAPIPDSVSTALGVRREVLHANPTHLELVVGDLELPWGDRGRTRHVAFGPGMRRNGAASAEDTLARAIATALASVHPSFGAVLLKADREALRSPEWCRSYGKGHAGSDELAGRELLLVRRNVPPYTSLSLDACVLRRTLGLAGELSPPASARLKTVREARRWRPDSCVIPTAVPADLLERELLRAAEAHGILNAIGRSRALSATSRRMVLLLDGRPCDLLGADVKVEPLNCVLERLGVLGLVEIPDRDARDAAMARLQSTRAEAVSKRRADLQLLIQQDPSVSIATLARRLSCCERTIRSDLSSIRVAEPDALQHEFSTLQRALSSSASPATRSIEDSLYVELQKLAATDVAAEVRRLTPAALEERSVRGHLKTLRRAIHDGAALVLPPRSDGRRGLRLVIQAVARILLRDKLAFAPPRSGSVRARGAGGAA